MKSLTKFQGEKHHKKSFIYKHKIVIFSHYKKIWKFQVPCIMDLAKVEFAKCQQFTSIKVTSIYVYIEKCQVVMICSLIPLQYFILF